VGRNPRRDPLPRVQAADHIDHLVLVPQELVDEARRVRRRTAGVRTDLSASVQKEPVDWRTGLVKVSSDQEAAVRSIDLLV
jgi:hypothetical protein